MNENRRFPHGFLNYLTVPELKPHRELEKKNARLLAERDVEIDVMKELLEKSSRRERTSRAGLVVCAA